VKASRFWWIYVVVTVVLTLATGVIWGTYMRWRGEQRRREEEGFRKVD